MSKVITFSRTYPSYHPKAGQPTHFVEKVWESIYLNGDNPIWLGENYTRITDLIPGLKTIGLHNIHVPKHHTIRAGHRWKVGDWFSPRVWSGRPRHSKQITFAPDIQIKKVWSFSIALDGLYIDQQRYLILNGLIRDVAVNDGLDLDDFLNWFKYPKRFDGQIICWNSEIEY